jgi:hypothetical protein
MRAKTMLDTLTENQNRQFNPACNTKAQHVQEMMEFAATIISHNRTEFKMVLIVSMMMHGNVMGVVNKGRHSKETAQNRSVNMIQKSKIAIENGTMRCVVQGQYEGSGVGFEMKNKINQAGKMKSPCWSTGGTALLHDQPPRASLSL